MHIRHAILAAALCVIATFAHAGQRIGPYQVYVNDAARYANGSIPDARASVDAVQWIGCYNNAGYGNCSAVTSAGVSRSCSTGNAAMIDTIRSIGPESYIYFQWNADGTCNYILVENSSRFKPAAVSGL